MNTLCVAYSLSDKLDANKKEKGRVLSQPMSGSKG